MKDWRRAVVLSGTTIRRAVEALEQEALQIVLVADENLRLLGTVTDGDIRRGLLKGVGLDNAVSLVMNRNPISSRIGTPKDQVLTLMREKHVRQCPMLTTDGVIDSLFYIDTFSERIRYSNPVILMAGGLGTRLAPLTNDCPKPLLKVGGKPIVEIILESFVEQGFEQFFISINYRAQMVKQYLGDGSTWNVHIHYLEEDNKLGTAGGLKLLPERPACPFIVMNADLLTKVNFGNLIHYHSEQKSIGTMGVREYDFQVPYGVVNVDEYKITKIVEKPLHRFFVNAGIYCLDPPSLDFIPHASYFDMPNLLQALLAAGKQLSCFPIREYWIDIGQLRDFQRANEEYAEQFLYVTRKK